MRVSLGHVGDVLVRYLLPQRFAVGVLALVLAASIGLQLASPQILRSFIDAATAASAAPLHLSLIAVLFIAAALVQQAMAVAATYVSERVGWTATNELRADLLRHCLGLDLAFHKRRTPGELIERIDGDVTALATFFSQFVVQLLGNLLLLLGILVALWLVDWRAGLVLLACSAVSAGYMAKVRTVAVPPWRAFRQASAELFGFIEERLAGTEDIRSSGATAYVMRRLYAFTRARISTGRRARLYGSIQWGGPIILFAMTTAASFGVAALLFSRGSITLGTAFLIYSYTSLSFRPLRIISNQMDDFQKAGAGLVRIQELLHTRSALADGPGDPIPPGALAVDFDHVSFAYESSGAPDDLALRDVSFHLRPGATLGLLGRTGSGKTTITRLLFRLYDPTAGAVRLGGVDLRRAKLADLRARVGLVTQDVQLFQATVRENVTLFDGSIPDARILEAFDELGLGGWLRALPRGLDTVLGAGGGGLSAGESQLLAFTRVLLRDPGLVILDEASSRLDPATERLIDGAVGRLLDGRTGIIIAHRLATVRRVDEIMVLERGRVVEHGEREALAAAGSSRFARLLAAGREAVAAGQPAGVA